MLSLRSKLASLALLAVALTPVAWAATATLFPVGFNPDNSLSGEAAGTGATTTFVLEGQTSGLPITVTLLEGASELAEGFSVGPLHVAAGCIISSGSAICQEVLSETGQVTTLETTIPFAPFAVEVTSAGAGATTTSASGSSPSSASSSASTRNSGSSSTPVKTSSAAPSSFTPSSAPVSGSASASAPSSAASASGPSSATAPSVASPIPTPAPTTTSGGSKLSAFKMAMVLPLAGAFWVLA
ncbi:hypothetical protein M0805_000548 [Coniferiporia weirii]|nr:hypothetical protein M0805_000548 [Coniferiporia weirii]